MIDDITKDLSDSDKLNLILAELANLRTWQQDLDDRMTGLERRPS